MNYKNIHTGKHLENGATEQNLTDDKDIIFESVGFFDVINYLVVAMTEQDTYQEIEPDYKSDVFSFAEMKKMFPDRFFRISS